MLLGPKQVVSTGERVMPNSVMFILLSVLKKQVKNKKDRINCIICEPALVYS